jgi:hypothetical protein
MLANLINGLVQWIWLTELNSIIEFHVISKAPEGFIPRPNDTEVLTQIWHYKNCSVLLLCSKCVPVSKQPELDNYVRE